MSISDFLEKIKGFRARMAAGQEWRPHVISDEVFFGLIVLLVAFGSFGLGRLSKIEGSKVPVRVENEPQTAFEAPLEMITAPAATAQSASVAGATTDQLVGSKTGKKYHYPWCAGASRIAEANRIYFTSKADAEARGYTPASNCKGL